MGTSPFGIMKSEHLAFVLLFSGLAITFVMFRPQQPSSQVEIELRQLQERMLSPQAGLQSVQAEIASLKESARLASLKESTHLASLKESASGEANSAALIEAQGKIVELQKAVAASTKESTHLASLKESASGEANSAALIEAQGKIVELQKAVAASTKAKSVVHMSNGEAVATKPGWVELPSGWDESGLATYQSITKKLHTAFLTTPESVQTYQTLPLGPVRMQKVQVPNLEFVTDWPKRRINGSPAWEKHTFVSFLKFIPGHTVHIDFGTWIGPTLFYAAQLVERAYGIEADPGAFAIVHANLMLNSGSPWGSRIHIQPGGIRLGSGTSPDPFQVEMTSAGAGNSCSTIGELTHSLCGDSKNQRKWKVNTYPLPALLHRWGVPLPSTFIKVDVEAFGCALLPSWLPWLKALEHKPTFHIAFHNGVRKCSADELVAIGELGRLFKHVIKSETGNAMSAKRLQGEWKQLSGEYVFSDNTRHWAPIGDD